MVQRSVVFEEHYQDYCRQIASVDFESIRERLGIQIKNNIAHIPFFNQTYQVSGQGIFNMDNEKADYVTCVVLAKYVLLCPDKLYQDEDWCTFRDFKKKSHITNANFFNIETTGKIKTHFSNRLNDLKTASVKINGTLQQMDLAYDLLVSFVALPRLSVLILMNEEDEDFPADCKVLFQRQSEHYLDPESLAMVSGLLAHKLIQTDKNNGG
ncbi:MAG: DUF3786 domain-containing protein [Desulfobacteraceae bacterium]|nr:DUF3786 domain-containing protein [Desulfobacteraceae bacterium]